MRTVLATLATLATLACCACASAVSSAPESRSGGSVTARWQPDVNWVNRHAVTTHGGPALAHRLGHDLAVARRVPPGVATCTIDTGAASRLTVRLGGAEKRAAVRLTGCRTVVPQAGPARYLTAALRGDLARIAPGRWQRYLTG